MYLRCSSRGALRAPVEVHDKVHAAEAAAAEAAEAAASKSGLAIHSA